MTNHHRFPPLIGAEEYARSTPRKSWADRVAKWLFVANVIVWGSLIAWHLGWIAYDVVANWPE